MGTPRIAAILRAMLTNLAALIAPKLYMRIRGETGRGGDCATDAELENYSNKVVDDYLRLLKMAGVGADNFFRNKIVAEYGPGDFLGVALIIHSMGARRVYCIDRFQLKDDQHYQKLYEKMFIKNPETGGIDRESWSDILGRHIIYTAAKDGVYVLPEKADLIISRAVLEHCYNLEKTFANMDQNLKPKGLMMHKVDLTSHGMHYKSPLDFLCYSTGIWYLMTSRKGYPNRWRRHAYRDLLKEHSFEILCEESLYDYSPDEVSFIRAELARPFKSMPDDDLLCSDYFFVARKN